MPAQTRCAPNGSCPAGLACVDGVCGGSVDAAPPDAVVVPADSAPFAIRIDIAGPAYTGIDYPGSWVADPGVGGICSGMEFDSPTPTVNGTNDSTLFAQQMFDTKLTCTIPDVPSGSYRVTLLFAELRLGASPCTATTPTSRVFDIAIEGTTVASKFDMTLAGGGCAATGGPGRAFDKSFVVDVTDGALDLVETASTGQAALNAIELVQQP